MSTLDNRIDVWIFGLALSALTGALLAVGCDARGDADDLGTAPYREGARKERAASPSHEQQIADLDKEVADADRGAQREIEQARKNSEKMPVASRERLEAAIG